MKARTLRQKFCSLSILACVLFFAFSSAQAQEKMKAGLWEMRVVSDMMKSMPKMPAIPPAQLAELKKRGISIPEMQNGGMLQKMCITKELAEQAWSKPNHATPGNCKQSSMNRSGNSYTMEMVCDGPMLKGNATITGSMKGDSLQSSYKFKGSSNNKPIDQHIETTGKWLGADCGDVKPIEGIMKAKK